MPKQYDADYWSDLANVEAQERKRQREQDGPEEIDLEVLAEWEAQDDFPDEDFGYGDWYEDDFGYGDPDEYDGE